LDTASERRRAGPEEPVTEEEIEQIALRLADVLEEREAMPAIVTAKELAAYLGVSRDVVYDNAEQLGAIRLGDGPKAHLRFPLDPSALRRWQARSASSPPPTAKRKRRKGRARPDVELIEYERGG
jgi:hypothetical protein